MAAKISAILLFGMVVLMAGACTSDSGLRPFTSDGCSLFPDSSLVSEDDWCSCCFEHDIAYWRGGTAEERDIADRKLQACVLQKTNNGSKIPGINAFRGCTSEHATRRILFRRSGFGV
jgi:hypothetical protein